jgi:hypothetical protein
MVRKSGSNMTTVVCQSYRVEDVPGSIRRCLETVSDWVARRGFDYRFEGDEFFDRVPGWYRDKVDQSKLPMSDLARLLWARALLGQGAQRVIWIDADVVVFDPDNFTIPNGLDYAFCREVWLRRGGRDKLLATEGVHNAVCVFAAGNAFLDFYIHACEEIVRGADGPVLSHQVGPDFLGRLADVIGGHLLTNVGLFSPIVTADIAKGGGRAATAQRRAFGHPVHAANLCASFLNRPDDGFTLTEKIMTRATDRLIETKGAVVNGTTGEPRD